MKSRTLNFPNPSRSYDEVSHVIRFWGYDLAIEISFFIDQSALSKIRPETKLTETEMLNTFDLHRDQICEAANNIYSRRGDNPHTFSYTLTSSNF